MTLIKINCPFCGHPVSAQVKYGFDRFGHRTFWNKISAQHVKVCTGMIAHKVKSDDRMSRLVHPVKITKREAE